jgi:hypothetical protein
MLRCLDVAVNACDAGKMKTMKLLAGHKTKRGAEVNLELLLHFLKNLNDFFKLFITWAVSGIHNGKTVHLLFLVGSCRLKDGLFIQKIIFFTIGVMVSGLGAEFAVFTATAASSADDGTQVYVVTAEFFANAVGIFAKGGKICVEKKRGVHIFCYSKPLNNCVCKFCNIFIPTHKKLPYFSMTF